MINTKFSIIIPVYNTNKHFIEECFKSVICQNYNNYEVIVINDGSTNDDTISILEQFKNTFNIVHQENKGLIKSRQVALKIATGDYIIFLDSDDILANNSLFAINEVINKYNPDVILQDPTRFYDSIDEEMAKTKNTYFKEGVVSKDEVLKQLCSLHINSINNKFVKRQLYDGISNEIDLSIINGEDLQQSTYVINKANSFYYIEDNIYYYRMSKIHRDYYKPTNINDINFLVPTYNMLFSENQNKKFLSFFKNAAMNAIIYAGFNISILKISNEDKYKHLDELNNTKAVNIIKSIHTKEPLISSLIFNTFINKQYLLFNMLGLIYNFIFNIKQI